MKVDRLYTMGQFIEYIDEVFDDTKHEAIDCWNAVWEYNKFLKQKPTEEQAINKYPRPMSLLSRTYSKDRRRFEEAEKKVIFEDVKYIKEIRNSGGNYNHVLKYGEIEVYIQWGGFFLSGKHEDEMKSLNDLAEATKGELKLKNVEI